MVFDRTAGTGILAHCCGCETLKCVARVGVEHTARDSETFRVASDGEERGASGTRATEVGAASRAGRASLLIFPPIVAVDWQ